MAISPKLLPVIRYWIPPALRDAYNLISGNAIVFAGEFDRWEAAERAAKGYADGNLFEHIETAALAVKNGQAAWEQDGVTRDHVPPDFPLQSCLLQAALANGGDLDVMDFGGGLGSTYHQARAYLKGVKRMRWNIVEQRHVVDSGRKHFQTDELHFHDSIDECLANETPTVAVLSSVLQYLPEPYELLGRIAASPIEYLFIDRHPRSMTRELITVQKIPPRLYAASYPAWLFDTGKMAAFLSATFEKVVAWDGKDPPIRGRGIGARYIGEFWQRRRTR